MLYRPDGLDDVDDDLLFAHFDSAARYDQRHVVSYCAELRLDEYDPTSRAYTASTLNVSAGGCLIRVYGAVAPETVASLHIDCGPTPVDLRVRVVWTGTDARGRLVGLAFDGLTPAQRLDVERLISAQSERRSRSKHF